MGFGLNRFWVGGLFGIALSNWVACSAAPGVSNAFDGIYKVAGAPIINTYNDCRHGPSIASTVIGCRHPPAQGAVVRIGALGTYAALWSGSFEPADRRVANDRMLAAEYGTRWSKYAYRLDRI